MAATIKQVAQRARVSMSTVSHVLNGTHYVSPELTERVLNAVKELDYQLNPVARSLAGGRSSTIGLLLPDLYSGYFGAILRGIDQVLADADYEMLLYTTHHKTARESEFVNSLVRGLAEGLLLVLPYNPDAYLGLLHKKRFPYVVIDHQGFDDFSATVVATNWQGAYEATRHLIGLGHRRIGFIAGASHTSSAIERLNGYRAALEESELPFDPDLVGDGNFERVEAYDVTEQLLDLSDPPTAIFAANDVSAFGVIDAVRNRGLRIPADISVVGFDDIPEASSMRPALTTVRQPLTEMGYIAAQMLLEYIKNPDLPTRRITLETELVVRESCSKRKERSSARLGH